MPENSSPLIQRIARTISAVCLLAGFAASPAAGQIRPRPDLPLAPTTPGAAPNNVQVVATSANTVSITWDAMPGVRAYMVERQQVDNPACCLARSGMLVTPGWQDAGLQPGMAYSYSVSVVYSDGRAGSTEVQVTPPIPEPPTVALSRGARMSSADGVLRLTPCAQRGSGGPAPGAVYAAMASPGWVSLEWETIPNDAQANYVVERQIADGAWKLIGSTCGGPAGVGGGYVGSTGKPVRSITDKTGGTSYSPLYRITAFGPSGEVGWNTFTWRKPCVYGPGLTAAVTGSTVTLTWPSSVSVCDRGNAYRVSSQPDTYTITSTYGYIKTKSAYGWTRESVYGVPLGTHTFRIVGGFRPDGTTTSMSATATVKY